MDDQMPGMLQISLCAEFFQAYISKVVKAWKRNTEELEIIRSGKIKFYPF
jgi:hypothetical protein